MEILHKLYLSRFSLITGALLVALPFVEFNNGALRALFGGFLDLTTFGETFWAICFGYLLSWSAIITFRITMLYGPARCGLLPKKEGPRFIETKLGAQAMFVIGLLLPLPLVTVIAVWHYTSGSQLLGIGFGFIAALVIVFVVDLFQRTFNTYHGNEQDDTAKQMFFPFDNWLSRKAEESAYFEKVFSGSFFDRLNKLLHRIGKTHGNGYFQQTAKGIVLNPGIVLAASMFLTYLAIYAIGFYFWTRPLLDGGLMWDSGFRAITYVFVIVTLLCWLLSGVAFHLDRHRVPTLLLVLAFLSFADLRHTYDVQLLNPKVAPKFATPTEVLNVRQKQPYIILVTANGGGIQSAAWATEVLTRFDQSCREIDKSPEGCRNAIGLMSGISGGSVGVMYYAGAFSGGLEHDADVAERIRKYSRGSSLEYVAGGLIYNDFVRNIPFTSLWMVNDRGKHLARGLAYNRNRVDCDDQKKSNPDVECNKTDIGNLSDWRGGVKDGIRPAIIFNATALETGQRVIFSTADFQPWNPEFEDWTTLQQLGGPDADLRVSEAVRLSAGFPYVSPAAKMLFPKAPPGNRGPYGPSLADGGYYDNYGLMSVKDFLEVAFTNGAWNGGSVPKVLIIQIFGEKPLRDPDSGKQRPPSYRFMSWFDQILAPLTGLLRVRGTGQYDQNDEAFEAIKRMMADRNLGVPEKFVFEFPTKCTDSGKCEPVPLSWHLTGHDITALETAGIGAFAVIETCESAKAAWPRLRCAIQQTIVDGAK